MKKKELKKEIEKLKEEIEFNKQSSELYERELVKDIENLTCENKKLKKGISELSDLIVKKDLELFDLRKLASVFVDVASKIKDDISKVL